MPQQREIFEQKLEVKPARGAAGPRLWVRRLVIWKEPGGEKVRDVKLRTGLNIIWTPDDNGIGHGGGKTLFCRLLRYCLGEDRFAPEEQRDLIGASFPDGVVGAEVVLDGTVWAILRPLGFRRRHLAIPNGSLDDLVLDDSPATGLDSFMDAVEHSILTKELGKLIPGHRHKQRAWPIALAWLMRDQECRFDHVLDWRSAASDSDSPARGLNQTEKLDALRAFFQAITVEEKILRAEIAELDESKHGLDQEIGHRHWEINSIKSQLIASLQLSEDAFTDGVTAIEILQRAAEDRIAASAHLENGGDTLGIESLREEYEAAREEMATLDRSVGILDVEIPAIERIIAKIEGEYPAQSYALSEAESIPCPICEVPIDRVLATQCNLSHKLPDIETIRRRLVNNRQELVDETARLILAKTNRTRAQQDLALARQRLNICEERLKKMEFARDSREQVWYSAKRLADDVTRLAGLFNEQQLATKDLQVLIGKGEQKRESVGAFLEQQARVFASISEKFDPIVRRLVGTGASGRATLTGNGLNLTVQMGGERSTAAIDSLKVLAFDFAGLCLSIEGATRVPAFLVHDSPREADLGLNLYHNIFQFMRWMEETIGDVPLFQYIVTTTTPPPDDLAKDPWLCLTVRGAPASERFLKCDL